MTISAATATTNNCTAPPTHLVITTTHTPDPKADWITHLPNKEGMICHFKDLADSIASTSVFNTSFVENVDLLSFLDGNMLKLMSLVRPTIIEVKTSSTMTEAEIIENIIRITNSMVYISSIRHSHTNVISIFAEIRDEDLMDKIRNFLAARFEDEETLEWLELPLMFKEDRNSLFYQSNSSYLQALLGQQTKIEAISQLASTSTSTLPLTPLPLTPKSPKSTTISPPQTKFTIQPQQEQQQQEFKINLNAIRMGQETKTTLMIKNIPNKYSQAALLEILQEKHRGKFNFLYLRMDFRNKCNVGYAFINMVKPANIIDLYQHLSNKGWPRYKSDKVCQITWAKIQGKHNLIHKFRGSKVMLEQEDYRPKLFDSKGDEVPFPL